MSSRRGIPVIVLSVLLVGGLSAMSGGEQPPVSASDAFVRGNALYESGDYSGAIEAYQQVVVSGVVEASLYYNLGNAYYKTNDLGNAVLYYERSARLSPRSNDVKENLSLVRTQLKDKQFVAGQNPIVQGVIWFHNNLRTGEMLWFASLCYLLLCLLVVLFILRDTRAVSAAYRKLSILSPGRLLGMTLTQETVAAMVVATVLLTTTGLSSYFKLQKELNPRDAVVVVREIPVFGSPTEDATLQFKIHEGTMVTAGEARRGWVRIQLPGGLSGWVAAHSIRKV